MKLQKVELSGFKSFADRQVIIFSAGLNGVVGPNGCGKSNITDAFKWVLGGQSTKDLRASSMQEVIFHGTSKRKPVHVAEVTITFSNTDRFLDIDYEEVAITRKLYRSGESVYLLNKQPIRLRDLHDLFAHSGIGREAFAIIEQGKVDSLIKSTPLQRRPLFEEAAGISRFLEKRNEAVKRLSKVQDSLVRVQDIVREVEQQMVLLAGQVEEAKRYTEEREELVLLEQFSCKKKLEERIHKKKRQQELQARIDNELILLEETIHKVQLQEHQEREKLADLQKKQLLTSEEMYSVKAKREMLDREIVLCTKTLHACTQKRQQVEVEQKKQEAEKKLLAQKKEEQRSAREAKQKEVEILKETHSSLLEKYDEYTRNVEQHEVKWKKIAELFREEERSINKLESEFRAYTVRKQALYDRIQDRRERREKCISACEQEQQQLELVHTEKRTLSEQLDHTRVQMKETAEQLSRLDVECAKYKSSIDQKKQVLMQSTASLSLIRKMKQEMQGISQGAKRLIQAAQAKTSVLFGKIRPLAEVVQFPDDSPEWVELFGQLYNSTVCVETEEDMKQVIAYVQEHKLQDISLFCQSLSSQELFRYIEKKQTYRDALVSGKMSVISRGQFVDGCGVLFLGGRTARELNLVIQDQELHALEKKVTDETAAMKDDERQIAEKEQEKRQYAQRMRDEEAVSKRFEREVFEKGYHIERLTKQIRDRIMEKESIDQQLQDLSKQEEQERNNCLNEEALTVKRDVLLQQQKEVQAQEVIVNDAKKQWRELTANKVELERAIYARTQELTQVSVSYESSSVRLQELEKTAVSLALEIGVCVEQERGSQEALHAVQDQAPLIKEELQKIDVLLVQENERVHMQQQMLVTCEQELVKVRQELQKKQITKAELDVSIAGISDHIDTLEKELFERFSLTAQEIHERSFVFSGSQSDLEKKIALLRSNAQTYAHVNLRSVEDYEACRVRKELLDREMADVISSRQELLTCIEDVEKESREQFMQVFEAIRERFRINFEVLFEGGQADLLLTDHQDPLVCGIDLVAKPPGKELQSVHLLSGGEKCLTALALLLSIFDLRPAPFCILDEVDAPLDEMNVDRFNKMITRYTERCQFLVVTHNKRTMLHADRLIGVSMQERGVSEVLQLELRSDKPVLIPNVKNGDAK